MTIATPPTVRRCSSPTPRYGGERRARWQFDLRHLLGAMLIVALLSGLWQIAPQLAAFAAGAGFALATAWRLLTAIRLGRRRRWAALAAVLSWVAFYAVSVGPAVAITQARPAWDPAFDALYAPLSKLCERESIYQAANWYLSYWRVAID